jgi:hypothetical protein
MEPGREGQSGKLSLRRLRSRWLESKAKIRHETIEMHDSSCVTFYFISFSHQAAWIGTTWFCETQYWCV